ncbi:zinc finger protein 488-like [Branchiostoma floridae x Branchiostoma japonicum]
MGQTMDEGREIRGQTMTDERDSTELLTGVWTTTDIPPRTVFGPYVSGTDDVDPAVLIGIRTKDKRMVSYAYKVDPGCCREAGETLKWLRLIQPARDRREQNMEAFQRAGKVYFRSVCHIRRDEELLVWYSDDWAVNIGIPDILPSFIAGEKNYQCPHCCKMFQFPNPLRAHMRYKCEKRQSAAAATNCKAGTAIFPSSTAAILPVTTKPVTVDIDLAVRTARMLKSVPAGVSKSGPGFSFHDLPKNMEEANGLAHGKTGGKTAPTSPESSSRTESLLTVRTSPPPRTSRSPETVSRHSPGGTSGSPQRHGNDSPSDGSRKRPNGDFPFQSSLHSKDTANVSSAKRPRSDSSDSSDSPFITNKSPERQTFQEETTSTGASKPYSPESRKTDTTSLSSHILLGRQVSNDGGSPLTPSSDTDDDGKSAFTEVTSSKSSSVAAKENLTPPLPEHRKSDSESRGTSNKLSSTSGRLLSSLGSIGQVLPASSGGTASAFSQPLRTAGGHHAVSPSYPPELNPFKVTNMDFPLEIKAPIANMAPINANLPPSMYLPRGDFDGPAAFLSAAADKPPAPMLFPGMGKIEPRPFIPRPPVIPHVPVPPLISSPTAAVTFNLPTQNWCAKCNASFRMTSDLVYHMRSHHKAEVDPTKRKREEKLRCDVCGESFRERHHLSRHMTSHQ